LNTRALTGEKSRGKLFVFEMKNRKRLKIRIHLCRLPLTTCLTSLILFKLGKETRREWAEAGLFLRNRASRGFAACCTMALKNKNTQGNARKSKRLLAV